jgi:hypothetical protein
MRVAQVAPPFQSVPHAGYGETKRVVSLVPQDLLAADVLLIDGTDDRGLS